MSYGWIEQIGRVLKFDYCASHRFRFSIVCSMECYAPETAVFVELAFMYITYLYVCIFIYGYDLLMLILALRTEQKTEG